MRKALILTVFMLMSAAFCKAQDRDLLLEPSPLPKDSVTFAATLSLQFAGRCIYEPVTRVFARQAIRELGPLRGLLAIADRKTRCARTALAGGHFYEDDGKVHEGVEVYKLRRE